MATGYLVRARTQYIKLQHKPGRPSKPNCVYTKNTAVLAVDFSLLQLGTKRHGELGVRFLVEQRRVQQQQQAEYQGVVISKETSPH